MKKFFLFFVILIFSACSNKKENLSNNDCSKIVSLAPSITETLFEMNLQKNIVGITKYCNYPPETSKIEKIGGYYDPNFEAILNLKPTVVMLQKEHFKAKEKLESLGLKTLELEYNSLKDIVSSAKKIASYCKADSSKIENLFNKELSASTENKIKPKILIVVGRNYNTETLSEIYIAGKSTFYNDIIELSGGTNSFSKDGIAYPKISIEGLIALNPDIIVDIVYGELTQNLDKISLKKDWESAKSINAVKNNKIFIINSDYAVIPSPRILKLIHELKKFVSSSISSEN